MFREVLGDARGRLLSQVSADWMDTQFGTQNGDSKIYTVSKASKGGFDIQKIDGGGMMSACCSQDLDGYIPSHLIPLFAPLKPVSAE